MWNWVLNLFGSPGRAIDMVEKAGSFAADMYDKGNFTDQERADYTKKLGDIKLEFVKQASTENSIQSIARRTVAYMVIGPYMSMIVVSGIMYGFNMEWSKFILTIVGEVFWIVAPVIGFFFGPYEMKKLDFFKGNNKS